MQGQVVQLAQDQLTVLHLLPLLLYVVCQVADSHVQLMHVMSWPIQPPQPVSNLIIVMKWYGFKGSLVAAQLFTVKLSQTATTHLEQLLVASNILEISSPLITSRKMQACRLAMSLSALYLGGALAQLWIKWLSSVCLRAHKRVSSSRRSKARVPAALYPQTCYQ